MDATWYNYKLDVKALQPLVLALALSAGSACDRAVTSETNTDGGEGKIAKWLKGGPENMRFLRAAFLVQATLAAGSSLADAHSTKFQTIDLPFPDESNFDFLDRMVSLNERFARGEVAFVNPALRRLAESALVRQEHDRPIDLEAWAHELVESVHAR